MMIPVLLLSVVVAEQLIKSVTIIPVKPRMIIPVALRTGLVSQGCVKVVSVFFGVEPDFIPRMMIPSFANVDPTRRNIETIKAAIVFLIVFISRISRF